MANDAVEYPSIDLVQRANFERKVKMAFGEYDGTMNAEFLRNNIASRGVSRVQARRERKQLAKKRFRNLSIGALLSILVMSSFNNIFLPIIQKNQSLDYIKENMVENDLVQITDDNVILNMSQFISSLEEKGLSRETSLYYIKEIYGDDIFDLAVKSMGYKGAEQYVFNQGYRDDVTTYSGNSVIQSHPDISDYNNSMSDTLIEEVNNIKRGK